MKQALANFDESAQFEGWRYVANVHDEVQLESHPVVAPKVAHVMVLAIRQAGKDLKLRCEMDASFNIGKNWSETH